MRRPFIITRMLSLFERLATKEFDSADDGAFENDDLLDSLTISLNSASPSF